ncbi:MAG TPA: hypothetical protein DD803_16130 [Alcaligenes faecalis]|nr:hypothetical protein [Alcaligenes faecalis]HBQ90965.1 hypothetical protein [Alcaligenes faecalis]
MSAIAYLFLLCCVLALVGMLDRAWLRFVRPVLARRFGWPAVHPSEHIPTAAWAGCAVAGFGIWLMLARIAPSAGF